MEIPVLSPPMNILELLYHSIIDLFSMLSSESKRIRQRRTLLHVPLLKIICILTTHPHSTGRRFRYAHGDLGFSLKLFQIAAEA